MWYDNWCSLGPLHRIIHNRALYEARMGTSDTLVDLISNGEWLWPSEWTNLFPELQQVTVPLLSDNKDRAVWIDSNGKVTEYPVKIAWESLRDSWPKVDWSHVVWFSQCTPKHAFILWLAIQGKLLKHDRMVAWHQGDDLKCSLCNNCIDSHRHLFFDCVFSTKVWKEVKSKGRFIRNCQDLNSVVAYIADGGNKNSVWHIMNKLIVAATVYFVWNERNKRNFQNIRRTEDEVIAVINNYMEDVLQRLKVKRSKAVLILAKIWKLTWDKGKLVRTIGVG